MASDPAPSRTATPSPEVVERDCAPLINLELARLASRGAGPQTRWVIHAYDLRVIFGIGTSSRVQPLVLTRATMRTTPKPGNHTDGYT
jgi:hypothetical protein